MSDKTCKERVKPHFQARIADIRKLWDVYREDPEAYDDDLGHFTEYGLSFDYVPAGTFNGQRIGFFRYQLSTGGPGDEFRFYVTGRFQLYKIEYWFLDWFDGAKVTLRSGTNYNLMAEIFEDFKETGTVEHTFNEAMADS